MPDKTNDPAQPVQPKRRRSRFWRTVKTLTVVALVGGAVVVYLARRPPKVWRDYQAFIRQTSPQERDALAQGVGDKIEQMIARSQRSLDESQAAADRVNTQLFVDLPKEDVAIDQVVELELTNEELSALVTVWFEDWADQRGYEIPDQLQQPVLAADKGELKMAFAITHEGWSQVFGGKVSLQFTPDGMAQGSVPEMTVGSLPVPAKSVGNVLRSEMPDGNASLADQIGQWIAQMERFDFRPVLEMEHRRRARVTGISVGQNSVTLSVRVQDHQTYKRHNGLMASGRINVFGDLPPIPQLPQGHEASATAVAEVPTD